MEQHPGQDEARPAGFFARLPVLQNALDAFDAVQYRPAPDAWSLVVTDIVDSTRAIENGRHKTVNFVAAMAIAALKNLTAPEPIPFLFGGDGAVVMVPPGHAEQARLVLARARGLARRDFGLDLRVGMTPVGELRRCGADVLVGRYEPSPGNSFGVFHGGGVALLEAAARGRGSSDLAARVSIAEALDDGQPVDLSGLSCRWDALRSKRGKMVTVIIQGAPEPRAIFSAVLRIAGQDRDTRPVRVDNLEASWPPKGFMLEARAISQGRRLAGSVLRVLGETLLARLVFAIGRPVANFDPDRYRREVATNTDFCKYDETLCFVFDCAVECVEPIRAYLEPFSARNEFRYGMDVSDTALMTCLVTSVADGLHVHFVDGGGGGYTNAAKALKAAAGRSAAGHRQP